MAAPRSFPLFAVLALLAAAPAAARGATPADRAPAGWPSTLEIGLRDPENGAGALAAGAPGLRLRYHYLSGDVLGRRNQHWSRYAEGNGSFVTKYIEDSRAHGFVPVFSLYSLMESSPGHAQSDEADWARLNLASAPTMKAYLESLQLFFERAAGGGLVVLHVEPDLWGYSHRAASDDDATTVFARVGTSGYAPAAALPDDLSGFARAIEQMRDRLAPNVALGYQLSVWGTGVDPAYSDESDAEVDALAARSARFFQSLRAGFDLLFFEFANADAALRVKLDGDPRARWGAADYARHARFIRGVTSATRRRAVLWQIPLGNTVMRAMDNTPGHYQDDRVQTLFGARMGDYLRAGVIGMLFGDALADATCACDKRGDGVTNPQPINGNTRESLNADDDGGYFREQVGRYASRGPLVLPTGRIAAPPAPGTEDGAPAAGDARLAFTGRFVGPRHTVPAGRATSVRVAVRSTAPTRVRVALQTRRGGAGPWRSAGERPLTLVAGRERSLTIRWRVPRTARGAYASRLVLRTNALRPRRLATLRLRGGTLRVGR